MSKQLLDLFVDNVYYYLQKENLTFKKIKFANGFDFALCSNNYEYAIILTKDFLLEYFNIYFFNLNRTNNYFLTPNSQNQPILPIIFHNLLKDYPDIVLKNLSSLSKFDKSEPFNKHYGILEYIFNDNDLAYYLIHYQDKKFVCTSYYGFSSLLKDIHSKFNGHQHYKDILFSIFSKHKKLIRKKNGNLIGVRTWAIKNLDDIRFLEEFLSLENENNLFFDVQCSTLLKFLDIKVVQAKYLINNAKGVDTYHNLLKSLVVILNNTAAKELLQINRVEGSFVFDKTKYQLTFFSKQILDSDNLEKIIDILLKAICDYYNLGDNKPEDFENTVLKLVQYYHLNEKLTAKNTKTGKVTKI